MTSSGRGSSILPSLDLMWKVRVFLRLRFYWLLLIVFSGLIVAIQEGFHLQSLLQINQTYDGGQIVISMGMEPLMWVPSAFRVFFPLSALVSSGPELGPQTRVVGPVAYYSLPLAIALHSGLIARSNLPVETYAFLRNRIAAILTQLGLISLPSTLLVVITSGLTGITTSVHSESIGDGAVSP